MLGYGYCSVMLYQQAMCMKRCRSC